MIGLHADKLFFRRAYTLLVSITWLSCTSGNAHAQYSDNLKDLKPSLPIIGYASVGTHKPTPIGDLGHIDTVVDLRGFIPLSHTSAELLLTWSGKGLRWYKVPTKKALLMLIQGNCPLITLPMTQQV